MVTTRLGAKRCLGFQESIGQNLPIVGVEDVPKRRPFSPLSIRRSWRSRSRAEASF